jgi:hypothetical protein
MTPAGTTSGPRCPCATTELLNAGSRSVGAAHALAGAVLLELLPLELLALELLEAPAQGEYRIASLLAGIVRRCREPRLAIVNFSVSGGRRRLLAAHRLSLFFVLLPGLTLCDSRRAPKHCERPGMFPFSSGGVPHSPRVLQCCRCRGVLVLQRQIGGDASK